MPVDRTNRDLMADSLAAFLRREISAHERFAQLAPLSERFDPLHEPQDRTEEDLLLRACWEELCWHPKGRCDRISPERWAYLCRCLACLRSDLEYEPPRFNWRSPPADAPFSRRDCRITALAFLVALAFVPFAGWWPVYACWVVSCLVFYGGGTIRANRRERAWREENPPPPVNAFDPFPDEATWRAHEGRLGAENIPPYNPAVWGPPPSRIGNGVRVVGMGLLLAGLLGAACAMMLFMWPLFVFLGCFVDFDEPASPPGQPGEPGPP